MKICKVSHAIVIVFCLCIYTGIVQAKELDYTECVPENREDVARIPKIIFSADYVTPEYTPGEDDEEPPILVYVDDIAMPITNIPGNAGGKVSIENASVYNNGRGIINSINLKVDGGVLEISPINARERDDLINLGTRVSRIHPIMSWRGKMLYIPVGGYIKTIQTQCTTFYKAANVDFKQLANNAPLIERNAFLRVFGPNN